MEKISGSVERITYYNQENGYSVLRIAPDEPQGAAEDPGSGNLAGRAYVALARSGRNASEVEANWKTARDLFQQAAGTFQEMREREIFTPVLEDDERESVRGVSACDSALAVIADLGDR